MSLWIGDEVAAKNNTRFLTDLTHPLIRRELEQRCSELGLRYDSPMTESQRRNFDRAMVAKYGERYPPPARTPWLLMIWDMLEQPTSKRA